MPRTTKAELEKVNESLATKLDAAEKQNSEIYVTLRVMSNMLYTLTKTLDGLLKYHGQEGRDA